MPILNQRYGGETSEGQPLNPMHGLRRFGPRMPVLIGVHSAASKFLAAAEKAVPQPIQGIGLIDSGASITSIDVKVAEKLGLAPTGVIKLGTAGGQTNAPTYAFSFSLPNLPTFDLPNGV